MDSIGVSPIGAKGLIGETNNGFNGFAFNDDLYSIPAALGTTTGSLPTQATGRQVPSADALVDSIGKLLQENRCASQHEDPLIAEDPCYDFLNLNVDQYIDGRDCKAAVKLPLGLLCDPSIKDTGADIWHLEEKNRRLEEENLLLRMQWTGYMQMVSQCALGQQAYGMSMSGYAPDRGESAPDIDRAAGHGKPKEAQQIIDCSHATSCIVGDSVELDEDGTIFATKKNTTVMLRNLPNSYTRELLLTLLNSQGFLGKYDFVYLPIDFKTHVSLAYAFVNLINAEEAKRFWNTFRGFSDWAIPSRKIAKVSWSQLQGLNAHIDRYQCSPVMHETVPEGFKPVIFSGTKRVPFPAPTEKVCLPKATTRTKAGPKARPPGRIL